MWLRVTDHPANTVGPILAVKFNDVGFLKLTHKEAFELAEVLVGSDRDKGGWK
jgi:hypothetical protein